MTDHKIHDSLPSGFSYADRLQEEQYEATGSVHGASKVIFVKTYLGGSPSVDLAVRLRPPRTAHDIVSPLGRSAVGADRPHLMMTRAQRDAVRDEYIRQYNNGWATARRGGYSTAWDSGRTSHAWDDGFLDGVAGRAKWHLTYCSNHDECGEG